MRENAWTKARAAVPEDLGLTRRGALTGGLAAFTMFALLSETSCARPMRRMAARDWIDRQGELARALRTGELAPMKWMVEVERLAAEVDVAELMAEAGKARITSNAPLPTNDPHKRSIRFLDSSGEPRKLGFAAALFDFSPTNVITPHGHTNMVSSHLVVGGKFRVRNFDRLRDEDGAMIVRPTRDYLAETGAISTMSSARDNVHWFVPQGGGATTFDVIISEIDKAQGDTRITAIDPLGGQTLEDGSIRAPIMEFEKASDKYVATI